MFNENISSPCGTDDFDDFYSNVNFNSGTDSGDLESPITAEEIKRAVKAIKVKKAAGPDGLIGEFYKYGLDDILPFLVTFFNHIFDNGHFPDDWTFSTIQPLHKKGDINQPENYRGISLLNICSKIYSSILNKRLTVWIEANNVLGEEQAGFREGRSTMDHVFTMLALVQKQLLRHKKNVCGFR